MKWQHDMQEDSVYTMTMLKAIEEIFPYEQEAETASFVVDAIEERQILSFRSAYRDMLKSQELDKALYGLEHYSEDTGNLQTTGVGLAKSFNKMVNVGLLLGQRVVLWDTVVRGAFFPPDGKVILEEVAQSVADLIALKKLVECGLVVMLPHPSSWLPRCGAYMHAVQQYEDLSPAFFGYVNAIALKDEGFDIQPYMLFEEDVSPFDIDAKIASVGLSRIPPAISPPVSKSLESIEGLLASKEFVFLEELEFRRLSDFVSHNAGWRQQLLKALRIPDYVKTEADRKEHIKGIIESLRDNIDKQNEYFLLEKSSLGSSGIGLLSASLQITSEPLEIAEFFGVIGTAGATLTAWLALSRKLKKSRDSNLTLIQGFKVLKNVYEEQRLEEMRRRLFPYNC